MRRVVGKTVGPRLFESDVSDAQVGFAFGQCNQLSRSGVVRLRTASLRHHADHPETLSRYGFCEIAQRLDGDGAEGAFCLIGSRLPVSTLACSKNNER